MYSGNLCDRFNLTSRDRDSLKTIWDDNAPFLNSMVIKMYKDINESEAYFKQTGKPRLSQANNPCMDSVYCYGCTTETLKELPGSAEFVFATLGPGLPAAHQLNPFTYNFASILECLNDSLFSSNLSNGMLAAKKKLINILLIKSSEIGGTDYKSHKSELFRKCVRSEANGFRLKLVHAMTQSDNTHLFRIIVTLFAVRDLLEGPWVNYSLEETGLLSYLDRFTTAPTYGYSSHEAIFDKSILNIQKKPRDTSNKNRLAPDWVYAPLKYQQKFLKPSHFTAIRNEIEAKNALNQLYLIKTVDALALSEKLAIKCRKKSGLVASTKSEKDDRESFSASFNTLALRENLPEKIRSKSGFVDKADKKKAERKKSAKDSIRSVSTGLIKKTKKAINTIHKANKSREEIYDLNDPFIDDSEQADGVRGPLHIFEDYNDMDTEAQESDECRIEKLDENPNFLQLENFKSLTDKQNKRWSLMLKRMEKRESKLQDLTTIKSKLEDADKWYEERLHNLKLQHPNVPVKLLPVIGDLHKLDMKRNQQDHFSDDEYDITNCTYITNDKSTNKQTKRQTALASVPTNIKSECKKKSQTKVE